ncbi:trithorax group protein osa-like [Ceratina calcarata]|uniref:Trithorax group protein osa-like n=1 Tax=Ceratina calcarata TaxID=156304 RepID=A0AAJ7S939_9HYME|nr:trithorax group protein osa-like [Ceratina calcarata]
MGEPKPASSPQPNGGVKQKPTSLNLAPGPGFYRNVNGRASLNDRHLQHVTAVVGGERVTRVVNKSASPSPAGAVNSTEPAGCNSATNAAVQLPALPTVPPLSALSSTWSLSAELENLLEPPPPPAPTHAPAITRRATGVLVNDHHQQQHQQQHQHQQQQQQPTTQQRNSVQSSPINQLPTRSPSHNGHGFPLYTPPAPIPASGANKIRSTPNGLPQPTAPRRPHSITAPPYLHVANVHHSLGQLGSRANATSTLPSSPAAASATVSTGTPTGATTPSSWSSNVGAASSAAVVSGLVQRRAHSVAGTPVSLPSNGGNNNGSGINGVNGQQEPRGGSGGNGGNGAPSVNGTVGPTTRSVVPPQSLWNGQLQQQLVPRRPHSIASTPVTTSTGMSAAGSATSATGVSSSTRTTGGGGGEPLQWGSSGMVLHQPIPRRAYASTLPHPQPPTPTSQGPALSILTNPGNSNTWTPGAGLRSRPHSIASTPQTAPMPPASPSDSGYRSLPSAASDYQILKSPSRSQQQTQQGQQQQNQTTATRRLSLPSAQSLLRANAPRPSPTFHGLPFRPFNCGVSPNGNPIFLGCTHLHNSSSGGTGSSTGTRTSTPATSPATPLTTSQAIQQLLAQPRNGFKIVDDKVSLFIEILDTQERFAKDACVGFVWFTGLINSLSSTNLERG